jgi:acyl-CoA synthetase (AMP-forming)/AMP-acid ligase II
MDRHWLKSYPEGVPHDIQPEQFTSLNQLLEESFKAHADKPFSVCMDRWMSYRELDNLSAALGAWLQQLDLEPGARVAIMLPNVPHVCSCHGGSPARRSYLRQRQSALHGT